MKKIKVNQEACIGCGACVAIDPEHFNFNDEGLSNPISNENLESENLKNAIESCPTTAISITEGEETCECEHCDCGDDCDCGEDCECDCEECHYTKEDNCGCKNTEEE